MSGGDALTYVHLREYGVRSGVAITGGDWIRHSAQLFPLLDPLNAIRIGS